MKNKGFYIPNLNGLRFIAAFAVILGHNEITKEQFDLTSLLISDIGFFNHGGGHLGVILFFVLSGFLITLLLLMEKSKFQNINYKKFIMRRALRIWPVYFLFVSIVIFAVHGIDSILEDKPNGELLIGMYYLILPNLAMSGFGSIMHIPHLWSIGVEEQFYLIWPLIIKFFKRKAIIVIMLLIVLLIPLIPHGADFLAVRIPSMKGFFKVLRLFFQYFLINSMAIGGLLAFVYYKYEEVLKSKLTVGISSLIVIICLIPWILGMHFYVLNDVVYPLIFGLLILVVSVSKPLLLLENRIFSYLGKISYGIYVYHWIVIYYVTSFLVKNFGEVNYFISLTIITILTVVLAAISYELMEKRILKFKSKFALIKSGKV